VADPEPIERLATTVADRTRVDWDAASAEATTDEERSLIRYLKWIDQIAAFSESVDSAGAASSIPPPGEAALGTWGHLRLLERTGEGAFGEVYRAWDLTLDREVALKLLRPRQSIEGAEPRLVDEARLLARIRHPNVVAVYGANEIEGRVGFWMDFIRGKTLERVLRDVGPLGAHDATLIGLDLCRALAAIHAVGLLHRDVKTSNVMREDGGRLFLMDLGAGRLAVTDPMSTGTDLSGTPAYLAPEIVQGGPASIQSDLYSVGVVLYRLVTRAYPIAATSLTSLKLAHASGRRARLRDVRPDLPRAFVRVVDRALAESPADRYASAGALEADLATALTESSDPATEQRAKNEARTIRGRRLVLAGGAVVAFAIGLGALLDIGGLRTRLTGGSAVALPTGSVRLPQQVMGRPSRDGRYLPYLDSSRNVMVWDALTSQSRRVGEHESGQPAPFATMSPVGDRVAYGWRLPEPDDAWELRVQDLNKPTSTALVPRETAFEPIPIDWSRDGRFVLCEFDQRDHTVDLALVPTDGGSPRILHTYSRQPVGRSTLSPDARFVVVPHDPDGPDRRLTIVSTDGSGHREVTDIQAFDARWTPDGQHLVLLRLDADPNEIWQVAIVDGRPTGPVQPVHALPPLPVGQDWTELYAVTDQGVVILEQNKRLVESYTVPIDRGFDHPPGPPTRVSPSRVGDHVGPSWSPDGRFLAYLDVSGSGPRRIIVKDAAAGIERVVPATLPFIGGHMPQWTPDGQFVIVYARDSDDPARTGLYRVAVGTGAASPVVILGPSRQMRLSPIFQCARNPSALLYLDAKRGLVAHDLATDRERVLLDWSQTNRILMFKVAFDGKTIALQRARGRDKEPVETLEVRTPDGTIHPILERPSAKAPALVAWTPSGDLLFEERVLAPDLSNVVNHLWKIASTGGAPHDVGFTVVFGGQNPVTVRPDGQQFAYTEDKMDCDLLVIPHLFAPRR